ncbi:hypothetical protein BGZ63DRAFT_402217 [Mariannaea sp. PMI_226]|nr:hypothetical protein BGZ63DRAFT_402217 [Mariannaea sp. PMI_226]
MPPRVGIDTAFDFRGFFQGQNAAEIIAAIDDLARGRAILPANIPRDTFSLYDVAPPHPLAYVQVFEQLLEPMVVAILNEESTTGEMEGLTARGKAMYFMLILRAMGVGAHIEPINLEYCREIAQGLPRYVDRYQVSIACEEYPNDGTPWTYLDYVMARRFYAPNHAFDQPMVLPETPPDLNRQNEPVETIEHDSPMVNGNASGNASDSGSGDFEIFEDEHENGGPAASASDAAESDMETDVNILHVTIDDVGYSGMALDFAYIQGTASNRSGLHTFSMSVLVANNMRGDNHESPQDDQDESPEDTDDSDADEVLISEADAPAVKKDVDDVASESDCDALNKLQNWDGLVLDEKAESEHSEYEDSDDESSEGEDSSDDDHDLAQAQAGTLAAIDPTWAQTQVRKALKIRRRQHKLERRRRRLAAAAAAAASEPAVPSEPINQLSLHKIDGSEDEQDQ